MHATRLTTASLASVLSAAALATPAAAMPARDGQDSGTPVPQPPTWPLNPQVIPRAHETAADSGAGFHWDAAGIGAGTILGAFAMGTAGVAVVRRRRVGRLSIGNH